MKRSIACSLFAALVCGALANADLVIQRPHEIDQKVAGLGVRSYADTFVAHKRAAVIASGIGKSCLGLYVFDAHGNCVAHDDYASAQTSDDLAADWIPPDTARYEVLIRNAGIDLNIYRIALR